MTTVVMRVQFIKARNERRVIQSITLTVINMFISIIMTTATKYMSFTLKFLTMLNTYSYGTLSCGDVTICIYLCTFTILAFCNR